MKNSTKDIGLAVAAGAVHGASMLPIGFVYGLGMAFSKVADIPHLSGLEKVGGKLKSAASSGFDKVEKFSEGLKEKLETPRPNLIEGSALAGFVLSTAFMLASVVNPVINAFQAPEKAGAEQTQPTSGRPVLQR
ncbi:MAG: hypothetical protein AUJ12_00770 [Alphaproteobacteria bacterium CG1_02_46_17]|nr:MAG: hypothetical protein AUJ12_00770 [Alphaproteobacteria bacterium CG1_02_46_17]